MPKIFDWAKEHPYATGAIIFGGGIVILLIIRSMGDGGSQNNSAAQYAAYQQAAAAEAASGNALQATQAQLQAAGNQTSAEAAVAQQQITSSADVQKNHDELAAQVAELVANLTAHSTDVTSSASVAINGQNNQTQQNHDELSFLNSILNMQFTNFLANIPPAPSAGAPATDGTGGHYEQSVFLTQGFIHPSPGGGFEFGTQLNPDTRDPFDLSQLHFPTTTLVH